MLTDVHIRGFKSLGDLKTPLHPLTVVFGPNAAGKSNFLEALLLLSRLVTERTVAEALSPPVRGLPLEAFHLPAGGLKGLLEQRSAELSIEARLRLPRTKERKSMQALTYRVSCDLRPSSGAVSLTDEFLASGNASSQPRIEKEGDQLAVRQSGKAGHPSYEPLPSNHTQVSNLRWSGKRYPLLDAVREELSAWRVYYLDPRDAMRGEQGPREVPDIGIRGESIAPFLFRLKQDEHLKGRFAAVRRGLQQVIPSIEGLDVDLDERRGTLDIRVTQGGTEYSSRIISEGTLRVLALCAINADPWGRSLIAFEEPENGVHPRRIQVVARILHNVAQQPDRQVVVTTHSPIFVQEALLLQREHPERVGILVCGREGDATTLRPLEDPRELFEDEAIRRSLSGDEDAALLSRMLERGWFGG